MPQQAKRAKDINYSVVTWFQPAGSWLSQSDDFNLKLLMVAAQRPFKAYN